MCCSLSCWCFALKYRNNYENGETFVIVESRREEDYYNTFSVVEGKGNMGNGFYCCCSKDDDDDDDGGAETIRVGGWQVNEMDGRRKETKEYRPPNGGEGTNGRPNNNYTNGPFLI